MRERLTYLWVSTLVLAAMIGTTALLLRFVPPSGLLATTVVILMGGTILTALVWAASISDVIYLWRLQRKRAREAAAYRPHQGRFPRDEDGLPFDPHRYCSSGCGCYGRASAEDMAA